MFPWLNGILELINSPLAGFSITLNPTLQPLLPCYPGMSCRCGPRFPEHRLQRHQEATASRGRSRAISTWPSGFNASFPRRDLKAGTQRAHPARHSQNQRASSGAKPNPPHRTHRRDVTFPTMPPAWEIACKIICRIHPLAISTGDNL